MSIEQERARAFDREVAKAARAAARRRAALLEEGQALRAQFGGVAEALDGLREASDDDHERWQLLDEWRAVEEAVALTDAALQSLTAPDWRRDAPGEAAETAAAACGVAD